MKIYLIKSLSSSSQQYGTKLTFMEESTKLLTSQHHTGHYGSLQPQYRLHKGIKKTFFHEFKFDRKIIFPFSNQQCFLDSRE